MLHVNIVLSNRDQKPGETPESYAAELKRLYDKAHSGRSTQVRCEDLLRRFFDGLRDEEAKVQVEFVKTPPDIDSAVAEVVNFLVTRKCSKPTSHSDGEKRMHSGCAVRAGNQGPYS